jgi:hypothetical protein
MITQYHHVLISHYTVSTKYSIIYRFSSTKNAPQNSISLRSHRPKRTPQKPKHHAMRMEDQNSQKKFRNTIRTFSTPSNDPLYATNPKRSENILPSSLSSKGRKSSYTATQRHMSHHPSSATPARKPLTKPERTPTAPPTSQTSPTIKDGEQDLRQPKPNLTRAKIRRPLKS